MKFSKKPQVSKKRNFLKFGKILTLLFLALTMLSACQKNEPKRFFSKSPEIDLAKELIKDYEDGNWDKWITYYADTAKIYRNVIEPASPKETLKSLQGILTNVSSYKFDDEDIWYEMVISDEGNKWVNFWGNWRGKLKANDKELIIPVHLTLQFVEGKIVEEYQYFNTSEFTAALREIEAAKMIEEESEDE
jgi:hypothetical protein